MRRGLTKWIVVPRFFASLSTRMGSATARKLMWLTRGFSPKTSSTSVCSMSGIGCIVLEPNTASLPANLFAQSWVPEPKERRMPS